MPVGATRSRLGPALSVRHRSFPIGSISVGNVPFLQDRTPVPVHGMSRRLGWPCPGEGMGLMFGLSGAGLRREARLG